MKKSLFRCGFTLIELMIVIVILGVLMGTILPRITGMQSKARDTAAVADVNMLSQALEAYYSEKNTYPPNPGTAGDGVCLIGTDAVSLAIDDHIKGMQVPTPSITVPILFGEVAACGTTGYVYLRTNDGYAIGGATSSKNNYGQPSITWDVDTTTEDVVAGYAIATKTAYLTTN